MISKVFITGATGFLGSTLAINLVKKNFDVSVLVQKNSNRSRLKEIENKILYVMNDDASLNNFFAQHRTDLIIHTACSYGRKNESISSILNSNLNLGIKLLELAEKNSIPFFINTHTALPRNMNAYSLSKHQFRDWLLKKNNYTKTMSIIFDHMYGPGDDDTKFIKLLSNKIINNEIINLTKCDQKRDFIYISDLVDAYLHLISSLKTNLSREYNEFEISSGKTIILITHSVEEALLLGEKVYVMAPRPGRIYKEYKLPFATMGLKQDLREIKNNKEFVSNREEILTMIWDMEEEMMGKEI